LLDEQSGLEGDGWMSLAANRRGRLFSYLRKTPLLFLSSVLG
jgi:hypothetical protein